MRKGLLVLVFCIGFFATLVYASVFVDNSQMDFDNGAYDNTEFNDTGVMLKHWNLSSLEMPSNKANDWIDMSGKVL